MVGITGNVKLQSVAKVSSNYLNMASLEPGNYVIKIEMDGEVVTKVFERMKK